MSRIVMLIHEDQGVYGASFPDFPGATTVARDIDTLFTKAAEMLAFHVEGMLEDDEEAAAPRSLQELRADPAFRAAAEDATIAMLSIDLPGRHMRVNISLDEGLLRRIDRVAQESGESRSGFLSVAAKERLSKLSGR